MIYQIQIKIIPGGHMDYYTKDTIVLRYDIINENGDKEIPFNIASEKRITLKMRPNWQKLTPKRLEWARARN